jgi:hypothetical protein
MAVSPPPSPPPPLPPPPALSPPSPHLNTTPQRICRLRDSIGDNTVGPVNMVFVAVLGTVDEGMFGERDSIQRYSHTGVRQPQG